MLSRLTIYLYILPRRDKKDRWKQYKYEYKSNETVKKKWTLRLDYDQKPQSKEKPESKEERFFFLFAHIICNL